MSDIVNRMNLSGCCICRDAGPEIERLRARVKALEAASSELLEAFTQPSCPVDRLQAAVKATRAALAAKGGGA